MIVGTKSLASSGQAGSEDHEREEQQTEAGHRPERAGQVDREELAAPGVPDPEADRDRDEGGDAEREHGVLQVLQGPDRDAVGTRQLTLSVSQVSTSFMRSPPPAATA